MEQFLEYSLIGLASGGLYVLAGLGFVMIYKGTSVFNFAMGEMMMLGAYFFYAAAAQLQLGWELGLLVALVLSGLLAMVIERVLLRPMLGRPAVVLVMITFGLVSVLRGLAGLIWGPGILQMPDFLPQAPIFVGDILIPGKLAWSFLAVGVVAAGFILYYRFSRAGVAIRATASDLITADTLGINIRHVFSRSWVLGGVLAAAAGVMLAGLNGLTPDLGVVLLDVIAVVMLGGVTSIAGIVIAGLFIGWLETIIGAYLSASWQSFLPYLIVLLVMMIRPTGLLGEQRMERI